MKRAPIYYTDWPSQAYRMIRLGRWAWTVRDGATGPIIAAGETRTEWGAHRRMLRAVAAMERRRHIVDIARPPLHPLTPAEASALTARLGAEGIDVLIEAGPVVHVTELLPLTTEQEVRMLYAVAAVTDARLVRHKAEAVSAR